MLTVLDQLEAIRFFDIKLMDTEDFLTLILRYAINLAISFAVVQGIYRKVTDSKEHLFSFYLMNTLVFLVCFIFDSAELSMGFAFGLFAIFGILRYRTETIPSKEMTYLFMLIAIAVINALAQKKISYAELLFANGIVVGITAMLEFTWLRQKEEHHIIEYERIDLITPEKRNELLKDLNQRTGVQYHRVEIDKIDFLRDTARVQAFYFRNKGKTDSDINIPDSVSMLLVIGCFFFLSSCSYVTVDETSSQVDGIVFQDEKEAPDLFDDSQVHEVRLYFNQASYWDSLIAEHENKDPLAGRTYMSCTMVVDNVLYEDVGVRLKGESSFDYTPRKKKSIKVDVDFPDTGRKHKGYRKFNLLNSHKDPSFLRDKIYSEYLIKHGVPAPQVSFAKVYINSEYRGLYVLAEQIDKHFLKDWFDTDDGNLYKGFPDPKLTWSKHRFWELETDYTLKHDGGEAKFVDLYELLQVINSADRHGEEAYALRLNEILNTDDLLKTFAINNFLMNFDTYATYYPHNYYLFNNPRTEKFEWISYDGNYTLAPWNPKFTFFEITDLPVLWNTKDYNKPLLTNMFNNAYFRQVYLDHLYRISILHKEEEFEEMIHSYADQIRDAVYQDTLKVYSNDEFEKSLTENIGDINDAGAFTPGLIPFMKERFSSVKMQLKNYGYTYSSSAQN